MPSMNLLGELVAAGSDGLEGWAWDPAQPYDPVEVEVINDGVVLARTIADKFDMDLARSRIGNGMHAFRIQLDKVPDGPYPITLMARIAGGPDIGGQLTFQSPADLSGVVVASAFHDCEGVIDGISDGRICGWVWNRINPSQKLTVKLWDGGNYIGEAKANNYRSDLAEAKKGNGHCGFFMDLPIDILNGELHSLRVRVGETDYELPGSPLAFGPSSASSLVDLVVRLRQEVAELKNQLQEVLSLDTDKANGIGDSRDADRLMQRTEALLTIQREALEREMRVLAGSQSSAHPGDTRESRIGRKNAGIFTTAQLDLPSS